jgi:hypothetical protein
MEHAKSKLELEPTVGATTISQLAIRFGNRLKLDLKI